MTIKEFIRRERKKQNSDIADRLERRINELGHWHFHDRYIEAAYEIKGMLFALLYSRYITAEEFESLMDDWAVITKDIFGT